MQKSTLSMCHKKEEVYTTTYSDFEEANQLY